MHEPSPIDPGPSPDASNPPPAPPADAAAFAAGGPSGVAGPAPTDAGVEGHPERETADKRERPAGPPALRVNGLSKRYDETQALSGLSFQVQPGEILGLVGPNGAGKTTALRSVSGVLPIQEGDVSVCGHDMLTDEVAVKRHLAWVPDDPEPFETLTVAEHLEFTAALHRISGHEERARDLLERFELVEKSEALGSELSRGMRQKLAIACAWLTRPRVILLDEPLSGLDPRGIRSAKDAIREIAAESTAVILSSHLLELIEELAHRILILDHGQRVFLGTLEDARSLHAPGDASNLEEIFFAATSEAGESEREPAPGPETEPREPEGGAPSP